MIIRKIPISRIKIRHCFQVSTARGALFIQEGDLMEKLNTFRDLAILRITRIQFQCNAGCVGGSQ
jgi:hypothetical protein